MSARHTDLPKNWKAPLRGNLPMLPAVGSLSEPGADRSPWLLLSSGLRRHADPVGTPPDRDGGDDFQILHLDD